MWPTHWHGEVQRNIWSVGCFVCGLDLGLFEWRSHSVFFIFTNWKASDKSGINVENDKELKMMKPNLRRNHNLVSFSHSSSSSDSQLQPGDFNRSENPPFMISQWHSWYILYLPLEEWGGRSRSKTVSLAKSETKFMCCQMISPSDAFSLKYQLFIVLRLSLRSILVFGPRPLT